MASIRPNFFLPHPEGPFQSLLDIIPAEAKNGSLIFDELLGFSNHILEESVKVSVGDVRMLLQDQPRINAKVDHISTRLIRLVFPDVNDDLWIQLSFDKNSAAYRNAVKELLLIGYAYPVRTFEMFPHDLPRNGPLEVDNPIDTLQTRISHLKCLPLVDQVLSHSLIERLQNIVIWTHWAHRRVEDDIAERAGSGQFPIPDGILVRIGQVGQAMANDGEDEAEIDCSDALKLFTQGIFHPQDFKYLIETVDLCDTLERLASEEGTPEPRHRFHAYDQDLIEDLNQLTSSEDESDRVDIFNRYQYIIGANFMVLPRFTQWDSEHSVLNLICIDNRGNDRDETVESDPALKEAIHREAEMIGRGRLGVFFVSLMANMKHDRVLVPNVVARRHLDELSSIGKFEGFGNIDAEHVGYYSINANVTNFRLGYQRQHATRICQRGEVKDDQAQAHSFEREVRKLLTASRESSKPYHVDTAFRPPAVDLEVPIAVYLLKMTVTAFENGNSVIDALTAASTDHFWSSYFVYRMASYCQLKNMESDWLLKRNHTSRPATDYWLRVSSNLRPYYRYRPYG